MRQTDARKDVRVSFYVSELSICIPASELVDLEGAVTVVAGSGEPGARGDLAANMADESEGVGDGTAGRDVGSVHSFF